MRNGDRFVFIPHSAFRIPHSRRVQPSFAVPQAVLNAIELTAGQ